MKETSGNESFRDHIATIDDKGKRNFVHPKKPKGKFTNQRSIVAAVLLVFMFAVPWIRINGQPFLLVDVLERKFIVLGNIFWPQDFYLLVISLITGILFVILFTVVFGRLFCGWVCPQTIFMEHVFRRIEYWIDGDRGQQVRLSKLPWNNPEKLRKTFIKQSIFWIISFIISNDLLMVVVGTDEWLKVVTDGPMAHFGNFLAIVVFTTVFYFVFSWFREQVCIIVCPYGRLHGAMLDRNSVVIAYDYKRGENRAKFRKKENREELGKGDCIDCNQCVDVCPTGIDIRNGTQLECINCTACIDACDAVMDRINLPKGLIKYSSEESIAEGKDHRYSARAKAYTVVLAILLVVMGFLLSSRDVVQVTVLRAPGTIYQTQPDGRISNIYTYKLLNKSGESQQIELKMIQPADAEIEFVGTKSVMELDMQDMLKGSIVVKVNPEELTGSSQELQMGLYANDVLIKEVELMFRGPRK